MDVWYVSWICSTTISRRITFIQPTHIVQVAWLIGHEGGGVTSDLSVLGGDGQFSVTEKVGGGGLVVLENEVNNLWGKETSITWLVSL